jgi:hypothetical protein
MLSEKYRKPAPVLHAERLLGVVEFLAVGDPYVAIPLSNGILSVVFRAVESALAARLLLDVLGKLFTQPTVNSVGVWVRPAVWVS